MKHLSTKEEINREFVSSGERKRKSHRTSVEKGNIGERCAKEGKSPVKKKLRRKEKSKAGHEESSVKRGGPPSKAKE